MSRRQPEKGNKDEQYEFLCIPFGFKLSTSAYNQALAAARAPRDKPEDNKGDNNNPDDDEEPDAKTTGVLDQDYTKHPGGNTRHRDGKTKPIRSGQIIGLRNQGHSCSTTNGPRKNEREDQLQQLE
jgi:hypothetical protein